MTAAVSLEYGAHNVCYIQALDSKCVINPLDLAGHHCKSTPPSTQKQALSDSRDATTAGTSECKARSEQLPKMRPNKIWGQLVDNMIQNTEAEEQQVVADKVVPITTLMICDLPCKKNISELVDVMHMYGFVDTYDFLYMPARRTKRSQENGRTGNVGYAFVNFRTPEYAADFLRVFRNVPFPNSSSPKLPYAKPAYLQGYEANMELYSTQAELPGALIRLPLMKS